MTRLVAIPHRGVVEVAGPDTISFLDGLVTASVAKIPVGGLGHGGLLTPQGKLMFAFFLHRFAEDGVRLETDRAAAADLTKRLGFYKLRAKVTVADRSDAFAVVVAFDGSLPEGFAADTRKPGLGGRALVTPDQAPPAEAIEAWTARRIAAGVPEAALDFTVTDVFPHDVSFDQTGGVDFRKGCYVGQEVVSRMQHRGTARKRVVIVSGDSLTAGAELMVGEKGLGALGQPAGGQALALVRLDKLKEALDGASALTVNGAPVTATLPPNAGYDWPTAVAAD